jgi:mannose/fructose-specific phosphotransferase system component IIA
VVCHGELAKGLVNSVEEISGIRGALTPVSNSGCDRGQLEERIVAAISGERAVVFVDLPSGSCLFAAVRRLAGAPDARVVTGVNLAMLLDFVFHREGSAEEAAARAVEAGSKAIAAR